MLKNKNITLYVTGSIAAYKALTLTRLLVKAQANVRVVMTEAAQKFVTPLSFQTLTKNRVLTDSFESVNPAVVDHVELARWSDLAIIAPASADFIGKMAQGLADDMACLTLLATNAPKFIAPAMNDQMWLSPAVQRNVHILQNDEVHFIDPDTGFLAEGYEGKGRMAEPAEIVNSLIAFSNLSKELVGKKVVVTAGGTQERIDPVRFIGNDSSGKMGYAVARAFLARGAEVTLISGPTKLTPPNNVKFISIESAAELQDQVIKNFATSDILVMAAAVADFKPVKQSKQKIKKDPTNDRWTLELTKNPDILQAVAKIKRLNQVTVGFAAETTDLINHATKKLCEKSLDLVVANDVSQPGVGFNVDTNQVTFISSDKTVESTELLTKSEIAELLVDKVIKKTAKSNSI
ncbi:bifunctional phosphopantothenoylcysteine decarboxylase/phosphopantothenate--cysteine ligase CoaBC [Xylocopilactobacillus apicola]|uniref:Coenzyme A biosynthesis bifunctional protein CoaBC n=1 Tax=Xylocopilactobacillus apicola TaxID=2932184 RepID=A0AAU9DQ26_9LACO|nr:bifunctional phosphopantothenoylcysteine decarboxylase/phosphopantothenate--cysteine ligase CoaBC [Xylocopilactobacillus apicola]BDR59307.1 DNA/pantothenate metabolism flavoprotein [Xylocopilactobacillus apicola]